MLKAVVAGPATGRTEVYVVVSGRLAPARNPVERRLIPVFAEAVTGILASRRSDDLLKLYLQCRQVGKVTTWPPSRKVCPTRGTGNCVRFCKDAADCTQGAGRWVGAASGRKSHPGFRPTNNRFPEGDSASRRSLRPPGGGREATQDCGPKRCDTIGSREFSIVQRGG